MEAKILQIMEETGVKYAEAEYALRECEGNLQ